MKLFHGKTDPAAGRCSLSADPFTTALEKHGFVYPAIFAVTLVRLIWNYFYGLVQPDLFCLLYHVFTYDYGFMPRALEASVLKLFLGPRLYSMRTLFMWEQALIILILVCFCYFAYYFTIKTHNFIGSALLLWWSLGIYSAFFGAEAGFLEQDGFLLACFVILISEKIKNTFAFSTLCAVSILICVLISETNAFIVCPLFIAMAVLRILEPLDNTPFADMAKTERGGVIKNLAAFVAMGVPSALYCFYWGIVKVPKEQIEKLEALIRSYTDEFDSWSGGNLDYYARCFYEGRLTGNFGAVGRIPEWQWQLKGYLVLISVVVILALIYAGYKRKALLYGVAVAFIMASSYVVGFIAMDHGRWKFSAAVMLTLFGIWTLRRLGSSKLVLNRDLLQLMAVTTVFVFLVMDYRFDFWSGQDIEYNTTWEQLSYIFGRIRSEF